MIKQTFGFIRYTYIFHSYAFLSKDLHALMSFLQVTYSDCE